MNTRQRQYRRFPCELTDEQIVKVKALADGTFLTSLNRSLFYTELARLIFDHGLDCPLFLAALSELRNPQPSEPNA